MHILVVNDDGPPSNQSSPYVHSLVKALQDVGHVVSVCLPHTQRSWIGKAHMIGQTVKPSYYRPGTLHKEDGTTHSRPLPVGSKPQEEWILVDGTPASCVQIGLYHYFQDLGPIDLVVSGPNYGRNSTAAFALSSGTLGGALEAATCRKKAIAISYAFESRDHEFDIIDIVSKHSVRIVEHLYKNWGESVDLYTINVPVRADVATRKIMQTNILQNYWGPSSCFEEVEDDSNDPDEEEQKIRESEGIDESSFATPVKHKHKHFKWAPRFIDVYKSVAASEPGNDGWTVKQGFTSITPLKANFWHVEAGMEGELKLPSVSQGMENHETSKKPSRHFHVVVDYADAYVQPLILSALASRLPQDSYSIVLSELETLDPSAGILYISSYEQLPFEEIMAYSDTCIANAYIIRKALIRKHYLALTAHNWITKHPSSILATNIKPSCDFELDYAEFLDDALVEAWDLQASFLLNQDKEPSDRDWWILKPGMSDRGQGIRLFSTQDELQSVFDEWEASRPESEDEDEDGDGDGDGDSSEGPGLRKEPGAARGDYIMTSQLRHFVAQPYIHPPLLLPLPSPSDPNNAPHKFHIRTYVVAVGSLKVYVYRPMLALFASKPYSPPWSSSSSPSDLSAHLTNTCLQEDSPSTSSSRPNTVCAFWSLPQPPSLPPSWKESIFSQICGATGEIFEAAARGMMVHFQTRPNAFEVFGLDYLVDATGTAWLLEVNAFPDFAQTGEDLRGLVADLWEGVVDVAVAGFFGVEGVTMENGNCQQGNMILVRELDLGRR